MLRGDFQASAQHLLTGRYTFDGFDQDAGDLATLFDFNASNTTRRNHIFNLNHKWILSGARLNEAYFQYESVQLPDAQQCRGDVLRHRPWIHAWWQPEQSAGR